MEQKIGMKPEIDLDREKYLNDEFSNILIDILTNRRLITKKVRTLKMKLKENLANSQLGDDATFFLKNSNLKEIHSIVTNDKAAKIFLYLDEGYNMRTLAELTHESPKKINPQFAGKYVSYWLEKFKILGLIFKSEISKGRETVYEKNTEKYPKLIEFLELICEENIKNLSKEKFESSARVLLNRRFQ